MITVGLHMDLDVVDVDGGDLDEPQVEIEAGLIMDELVALTEAGCGIADPAVSLDLEEHTVTIELSVTAVDFEAAADLASSSIRSAIHAAGGHTTTWLTRSRSETLVDA